MSNFDDLIRAGRDTDAMRYLAHELYKGGRTGHTRKLLMERVADGYGLYKRAFEEVCRQFNYGDEKDYEDMRDEFLRMVGKPEDEGRLETMRELPIVVKPDPLDVQIDVMLDCLWAEKRAKLKAHLKPLLSDAETWDMVKHIVRRGLA